MSPVCSGHRHCEADGTDITQPNNRLIWCHFNNMFMEFDSDYGDSPGGLLVSSAHYLRDSVSAALYDMSCNQ